MCCLQKIRKAKQFSIFYFHFFIIITYLCIAIGGLAQLARALAWHARGHRFEPDILHKTAEQMGSLLRGCLSSFVVGISCRQSIFS